MHTKKCYWKENYKSKQKKFLNYNNNNKIKIKNLNNKSSKDERGIAFGCALNARIDYEKIWCAIMDVIE